MYDKSAQLNSEVLKLRDDFLDLAARIATKYSTQRVTEKTVANLLMKRICERSIIENLKFEVEDANDIDRVWRNLHDYAVTLLVERLKNELIAVGIPVSIVHEAESPTGRYDVLIISGRSIQVLNGNENICLELKVGLNISLDQLERYLWNGATLMLVRFATGDVVTLKASEWAGLLKATLRDRIEKARRILEGKAILVPGKDCRDCILKECKFNRNKGSNVKMMIRPQNLAELLEGFKQKANVTIDAAVKSVVWELERAW